MTTIAEVFPATALDCCPEPSFPSSVEDCADCDRKVWVDNNLSYQAWAAGKIVCVGCFVKEHENG